MYIKPLLHTTFTIINKILPLSNEKVRVKLSDP